MYKCSTDEQIDFKHKFILLCNKRLMYIPVYQCFFLMKFSYHTYCTPFLQKRAKHCFTVDKIGIVNLNYMYSYKP